MTNYVTHRSSEHVEARREQVRQIRKSKARKKITPLQGASAKTSAGSKKTR